MTEDGIRSVEHVDFGTQPISEFWQTPTVAFDEANLLKRIEDEVASTVDFLERDKHVEFFWRARRCCEALFQFELRIEPAAAVNDRPELEPLWQKIKAKRKGDRRLVTKLETRFLALQRYGNQGAHFQGQTLHAADDPAFVAEALYTLLNELLVQQLQRPTAGSLRSVIERLGTAGHRAREAVRAWPAVDQPPRRDVTASLDDSSSDADSPAAASSPLPRPSVPDRESRQPRRGRFAAWPILAVLAVGAMAGGAWYLGGRSQLVTRTATDGGLARDAYAEADGAPLRTTGCPITSTYRLEEFLTENENDSDRSGFRIAPNADRAFEILRAGSRTRPSRQGPNQRIFLVRERISARVGWDFFEYSEVSHSCPQFWPETSHADAGEGGSDVPATDGGVPSVTAGSSDTTVATCPQGTVRFAGGELDFGEPFPRDWLREPRQFGLRATVAPFCLQRRAVRVRDLVHAGIERSARSSSAFAGSGCDADQTRYATCVTHDEASRYCTAIGGRLPTLVEWEIQERARTRSAVALVASTGEWVSDPFPSPSWGRDEIRPQSGTFLCRMGVIDSSDRPDGGAHYSWTISSASPWAGNVGFRCAFSLRSAAQ